MALPFYAKELRNTCQTPRIINLYCFSLRLTLSLSTDVAAGWGWGWGRGVEVWVGNEEQRLKETLRGRDTHLLVVVRRVSAAGACSSRAWSTAHSRTYQAAFQKWGRQRSTCRDISKSRAGLTIPVSAGRETSSRVQGFRRFGDLAETLWRLLALPDIYPCWRQGRQGGGAERNYSVCTVPDTVAHSGLDKSRRGRGG